METLTSYLAVAAGGALGATLRYFIGGTMFERSADASDPHQSIGAERDIRDASIRPEKT